MNEEFQKEFEEAQKRSKALCEDLHRAMKAHYEGSDSLPTYEVIMALATMLGAIVAVIGETSVKAHSLAFAFKHIAMLAGGENVTAEIRPHAEAPRTLQ